MDIRWHPSVHGLTWTFIPLSYRQNAQSLRTELHFQFIRFAAATLLFAFTPSVGFPHFWRVRFKKTEQDRAEGTSSPQCIVLAFPSALFGAPFHIDKPKPSQNCGFWLEYASKTTSRGRSRPPT